MNDTERLLAAKLLAAIHAERAALAPYECKLGDIKAVSVAMDVRRREAEERLTGLMAAVEAII